MTRLRRWQAFKGTMPSWVVTWARSGARAQEVEHTSEQSADQTVVRASHTVVGRRRGARRHGRGAGLRGRIPGRGNGRSGRRDTGRGTTPGLDGRWRAQPIDRHSRGQRVRSGEVRTNGAVISGTVVGRVGVGARRGHSVRALPLGPVRVRGGRATPRCRTGNRSSPSVALVSIRSLTRRRVAARCRLIRGAGRQPQDHGGGDDRHGGQQADEGDSQTPPPPADHDAAPDGHDEVDDEAQKFPHGRTSCPSCGQWWCRTQPRRAGVQRPCTAPGSSLSG